MLDKLKALGPVSWVLGNLPLVAGGAGVVIALLAAAYFTGRTHGSEACEADRANVVNEALEKAREADGEASKTVREHMIEVERENEEARKAAENSSDTLKSGVDSLRPD